MLAPRQAFNRPEPAHVEIFGADKSTHSGLAALEGELEELGRAPVGTRNHTLNRCAFRLGRLVAGGELCEADVVNASGSRH